MEASFRSTARKTMGTQSLQNHQKDIAELCRRFGVARLGLFGSAARSDSSEEPNDLDFLVVFRDDHSELLFDRYFGLKESLEALFEKPVDIVEERAIRNPFFREEVETHRVWVHGWENG
jgi:predicted nucleotidyltransferase